MAGTPHLQCQGRGWGKKGLVSLPGQDHTTCSKQLTISTLLYDVPATFSTKVMPPPQGQPALKHSRERCSQIHQCGFITTATGGSWYWGPTAILTPSSCQIFCPNEMKQEAGQVPKSGPHLNPHYPTPVHSHSAPSGSR